MFSLTFVLVILSFVLVILSAAGYAPLWVSVFLLALIQLLHVLPLK
jgi:hypothetical protein